MTNRSSFQKTGILLAAILLIATSGCYQELQKGYGRARGASYTGSVNGTIVFHEMIEAAGHEVDRYRKYSPRWEKYDTVFWIPESYEAPSEEVIGKIENWLASERYRTLVYVARDFDATMMYWETLVENESDPIAKDDLDRQYVDAMTTYLYKKSQLPLQKCSWFDVKNHPYSVALESEGLLTEGIDEDQLSIRYSSLPDSEDINEDDSDLKTDYEVEVLMSVDSLPFIYSLTNRRFRNSRIIIVGNSSFLLNLPLAESPNRELALNLIELANENDYGFSPVLFIESNSQLEISERDAPEIQSQWHWITQEPLRYIVPNILFCCLLFCFVYFPIFGRPKKIKQQSTTDFRDHIEALGQLIEKTKSFELPKSWIEEYKRRNHR